MLIIIVKKSIKFFFIGQFKYLHFNFFSGRSKIHAKNAAAEVALKHLIKSNKLSEMKKDEEGNEKMDVTEDGTQPPLPWQHVASFALYKLFTSWGEDLNKGSKVSVTFSLFIKQF